MPPKSTKTTKKPAENENYRKISTYFKPTPKETIKRKLETDENSQNGHESLKRTPSPPNTPKTEKKKPGLSIKSNRPVLRDINPAQSLNQNNPDTHIIRPTFAVLSDADIERGLEKAATPPIQVYSDKPTTSGMLVYRDSQEENEDDETRTGNDHLSSKRDLNTQSIPDSEGQWTQGEDDRSPIQVFEDEPFEISASQIQEKVDYEKYGPRKTKTDENAAEVQNDDEDDDDFDDSDLFTKTVDTTVQFRPTQASDSKESEHSDNNDDDDDDGLFFSNPLQSITGSTFFDDEKDDTFIDTHEFSVGGIEDNDEEFEFSIGEEEEPTLSPDSVEPVDQVHVSYPNPRGKTILEKLAITKTPPVDDELPT